MRIGECIGEGEYGKVFKAVLTTASDYQTVAAKTLKSQKGN